MMDQQIAPRLGADPFLLHAPSVYDFRERDDMLFAYLSDSNSVDVTSVYEMYPIGWFSIKQRLADHGFDAKIVNVASLMLMHLIWQPYLFHRKDTQAGRITAS
jgi:clorobiocin/coumermycin A biosynthesis protein CloN6/CouN6